MKTAIDFLNRIQANNNKTWFDAHKEEYKQIQERFNCFVEELITGIAKFDESIRDLSYKQCIYRFYRDIRFSSDKRPYKNHLGAYICPNGRKSGNSGYYFHIEATGGDYLGGNLISTGCYCPEKLALASIRDDICYQGANYIKAIQEAKDFYVNYEYSLKKLPTGFPIDTPYPELVKLKSFLLFQTIPLDILFSSHLLEFVLTQFETTYNFNKLLNRAIDYSKDPEADF